MKIIRRTGPLADFNMPGAYATIPDLTFTGDFDDGELLLLASMHANNSGAASGFYQFRFLLDGAVISTQEFACARVATADAGMTLSHLLSLSEGRHTIAIQCTNNGTATHRLLANKSHLIIIQFPIWVTFPDIT